jgi:integrase
MTPRALTDRLVQTLQPTGGQRLEIRDTKPRGLILRVSATGVKAWSVLYRRRIDGLRRRCTLGTFPQVTLADARSGALDVLARVSRGEDPAADRKRPTDGRPLTFGTLAERYLAQHANLNKRSVRQDRQILEKDVLPSLRNKPLESIKRADIASIVHAIVARGAPIQANRSFEIIRGLYNWALGNGLVETTPCLGLRAPAQEQSRDRTLTDDEIRLFWEGLATAPMSWSVAHILRLCLATAQRVSEVSGARHAELDLRALEWRLPGDRVKNGSAHLVPLSPLAAELFDEALARSKSTKFVFCSPMTKRPIIGQAVAKAMRRSLEHLHLEDVTPHDLRRTAATNMAKRGIARLVVDKVLNHVSADRSTIAGVYDRYGYAEEKKQALCVWATALQSITSGHSSQVIALRGRRAT